MRLTFRLLTSARAFAFVADIFEFFIRQMLYANKRIMSSA